MATLGVVLPTRNSMAHLPAHVAAVKPWLDLAREIVVVDSFSSDGTLEFLRRELNHPGIRFETHPPGLYASWNHGLGLLGTDFAYVATVGDTIERAGLQRMLEVAADFEADVVISKPRFVFPDGGAAADWRWPVDEITESLQLRKPAALPPLQALVFAIAHADAAMLGSSASNLYRPATFKRFPFPTDHGLGGDGKWGVIHAGEVRWVVFPDKVSTFLRHENQHDPAILKAWEKVQPASALAREAVERTIAAGRATRQELADAGVLAVLDSFATYFDSKQRLDRLRRGAWPWVLSLEAWRLRFGRGRRWRDLQACKRAALNRIRADAN
jgi:glycosyltransferase involved in cell wall biosynthesis